MRRSHLLRLTGPTSRQRMLLLPVVLLLFLAGAAAPATAEVLREETAERYALAPGGRVEITNVNGNLEFSSWERDEVLLETTKVVKALGHGRAARAIEDLRIEVEHTPELLE
ncbi:MAG TPA: hypothetical protein VMS86_14235, partial [Thermoanaerobaculia bacterium]|nr:hypothetical protein [Thermoanaerobaculia bacterium]